MSKNVITDFTYGEISRKSDGRSDLGAYYKSCAELRNMYVTPQGVASRMPGTEFVSSYLGAVSTYNAVRIVPFWINESESYIFIFTPAHLYYYRIGTGIDNDWAAEEIKDSSNNAFVPSATPSVCKRIIEQFQYVQMDKVLYFVHQELGVKKVTYSSGSFKWASVTIGSGSPIVTESWGNPGACTSYQQRLILGNFANRPTYYAGSSSRVPEDSGWKAASNVNAGDSFYCEVTAGNDYSPIRWISAEKGLIIGTATKEVLVAPDDVITPSNASNQQLISTYGSGKVRAMQMGLSLLFTDRTEERLREYAFTGDAGNMNSPDLTVLADDILEGGIKQMCFQNSPFECLFVLRNDGVLCMFTYDRDTGISAWSRVDVGGEIESITTAPGEGQDYTYLIVHRQIGSVVYRYLERFSDYKKPTKNEWKYANSCKTVDFGRKTVSGYSVDADTGVITVTASSHGLSDGDHVKIDGIKAQKDYGDGVYYDAPCELNGRVFRIADSDTNTFTLQNENFQYIDGSSYAEYVSGGTVYILSKNITGMSHLEGCVCSIVADGGTQANRAVESGGMTIERLANVVQIGLPYTSYIKTNRLVPQAMGEVRRINRVHVRFYRSLGCTVAKTLEDKGQDISFRENELNLESPGVYTGDKSEVLSDDYNTDGYIYLIQREPLPFNICAVGIDYKLDSKAGGR